MEDQDYQELWNSIRARARRRGADAHTAEDVAQEALLRALRRPRPHQPSLLLGWLHVVARRVFVEQRVSQKRRVDRELIAARNGQRTHVLPEEESCLLQCLQELEPHYQVVIRLRYLDDVPLESIAAQLGVPVETVRSRLRRGLGRLRRRLAGQRERHWAFALLRWIGWPWHSTRMRVLQACCGLAAVSVLAFVMFLGQVNADAGRLLPGPAPASAADPLVSSPLAFPGTSSSRVVERSRGTPVPGNTLRGLVLNPLGQPVAAARVRLSTYDEARPDVSTVTDESGRFALRGQGDLLSASHADWRDSLSILVPSIADPGDVTISLEATGGRFRVRVQSHDGASVEDALVSIEPTSVSNQSATSGGLLAYPPAPTSVRTDESGAAWILAPPSRDIDLVVVSPHSTSWSDTVRLPSAGEDICIRLPAPITLSGACQLVGGVAPGELEIEVLQLGGRVRRTARTDTEGHFRVDGLSPGAYVLRCGGAWDKSVSARSEGLLAPEEPAFLDLRLETTWSIEGRVVQGGTPVVGGLVLLECANPHSGEEMERRTRTDGNGRFVFWGCRPVVANRLDFSPAGGEEPIHSVDLVRAGNGEDVYELGEHAFGSIVIDFMQTEGQIPRLVELRRAFPHQSRVVAAEPGSSRFIFPDCADGSYTIFGWHPRLGAWQDRSIEHRPPAETHVLLEPCLDARLEVHLDPTPGTVWSGLEVFLLAVSFDRYGSRSIDLPRSGRFLSWDEEVGAYVGTLAPGPYPLIVRGSGVVGTEQSVKLEAGTTVVRRTIHSAAEATIVLLTDANSVKPNDWVTFEALTPHEAVRGELRGLDLRKVRGAFEATMLIPKDTFEIRATTRPHSQALGSAFKPRSWHRLVGLDDLNASSGRPRLELSLAP